MRMCRATIILLLAMTAQTTTETVQAADGYVCDCAAGADTDCLAGDDAGSGHINDPWRTYSKARSAFAALAPGEAIRFCRGGKWQFNGAADWVNSNCTAAQPCRVEAYVPPWGSGDEARPVLQRTGAGDAFSLANPGNAAPQAGYSFANLHLVGTGDGQGFFLFNDIDDVTIDGMRIENFALGVHVAGSNPCSADPACDGRNERIVLRNSQVVDNTVQGWLGASTGSRLLGNLFDGNGSQPSLHHNVYLASETETFGIEVVGNILRNSALNASGRCTGASLAGHGLHTDMLIEGNLIEETMGTAEPGCWGLVIDPAYAIGEQFTRLVIRGNTVRNVGNVAIGTASCVDCVIENNQIIQETPIGGYGIVVPNRNLGPDDAQDTGLTIRNNSIYYAGDATGVAVNATGSQHRVVSNTIQTSGNGAGFACFETDLAPAAFDAMNHNLCDPGNAGEWVPGQGDLTAWQANTGLDMASSTGDPLYIDVAAGNLGAASATSPMIDTGSPTLSATNAIDGLPRGVAPDRGAHEWRGAHIFRDEFELLPR